MTAAISRPNPRREMMLTTVMNSADHGSPAIVQPPSSDEALAGLAQAGSMPHFVELHDRFQGRVFNFLLRRGANRNDAEDLTQETFLRAWRHICKYRTGMRFSTWLFTIAVRLQIDQGRANRARQRVKQHWSQIATHQTAPADFDEARDNQHRGRNLWAMAMTVLSRDQHAALWLRYAEDLSVSEIAQVMHRNAVAVRVMLFRARQTLVQHVQELECGKEGIAGPSLFARASQARGVS